VSDISTFLGIFEDESESTQVSEGKPLAALNHEEEFFLQQMKDLNIKKVLPKFTPDGITFGELASLLTYYDNDQMRVLLESLSQKGYIKKMNYGTVAMCPSCYSPVVMIVLSCPRCGSMKLTKKEVVKHRACGYTGYAEDYFDGIECRCPLCGAIYDTAEHHDPDAEDDAGFTMAESTYECDDCGSVSGKPSVTYNCIKCKTKFHSKDICFENPKGYEMIDPEKMASMRDARQEAVHPGAVEEEMITPDEAINAEIKHHERLEETHLEEESEQPVIAEEPEYEEPESMHAPEETYLEEEPEQPVIAEEPEYEEPESMRVPEEPAIEEGEAEDFQLEYTETSETLEPEEPGGLEEDDIRTPPEPAVEDEAPKQEKKRLFGGLFSKNEKKGKPKPVEKKPMRVEREVVHRKETSILLIEQSEETATKILERLERTRLQNVEVRHAFTGRLGLRELRREHDAIILDTELDDIDPKLILLEMVRWKIETPIIVICNDEAKVKSYMGYKLSRVEFIDSSEMSLKRVSAIINDLLS
jgi:CheY-like chemotaxis protein